MLTSTTIDTPCATTRSPHWRRDSKELAEILRQYPGYKLKIEGYCDERGSAEYNVALGDARAKAAKDYLVNAGVAASQLDTVSFGKENPVCCGTRRSLLAEESPRAYRGGKDS